MYYVNTFFLFSILGHFIEDFFYVTKDSGIFFGWWTPIYGIGVCIVIYLYKLVNKTFKLNKISKPIIVFLIGFIMFCRLISNNFCCKFWCNITLWIS